MTKEKPTEFGPGMGDAEKETDAIELGKYGNAVGCYPPIPAFADTREISRERPFAHCTKVAVTSGRAAAAPRRLSNCSGVRVSARFRPDRAWYLEQVLAKTFSALDLGCVDMGSLSARLEAEP